jgi:hypothetical protein
MLYLGACLFVIVVMLIVITCATFGTVLLVLALRDLLPVWAVIVLGVLLWFVLLVAFGMLAHFVIFYPERRFVRRFLARPVLSREEFVALFPEPQQTAARIVHELFVERLLVPADIAGRLRPDDQLLALYLMDVNFDDLDWMEMLFEAAGRLQVPAVEVWYQQTVGELMTALTAPPNNS